jgi:hypothetical protein
VLVTEAAQSTKPLNKFFYNFYWGNGSLPEMAAYASAKADLGLENWAGSAFL